MISGAAYRFFVKKKLFTSASERGTGADGTLSGTVPQAGDISAPGGISGCPRSERAGDAFGGTAGENCAYRGPASARKHCICIKIPGLRPHGNRGAGRLSGSGKESRHFRRFIGSVYGVEYIIHQEKIGNGRHYGRITVRQGKQELRFELEVTNSEKHVTSRKNNGARPSNKLPSRAAISIWQSITRLPYLVSGHLGGHRAVRKSRRRHGVGDAGKSMAVREP